MAHSGCRGFTPSRCGAIKAWLYLHCICYIISFMIGFVLQLTVLQMSVSQPPAPISVTIEYTQALWFAWYNCLEGETPGGGDDPMRVVRASSDGWWESSGSCPATSAEVSWPLIGNRTVDLTSPGGDSFGPCWDAVRGTCSFHFPGPVMIGSLNLTFSEPVWTGFFLDCIDDAGSSGVPRQSIAVQTSGSFSGPCLQPFRFTSHRADFTADGLIDGADLAVLFALWGHGEFRRPDLNDDGLVDGQDLAVLLSQWGPLESL
jgi:hypothetical protein